MEVDMKLFEVVKDLAVGFGVSFALSGGTCLLAAGLTYVVRVLVT